MVYSPTAERMFVEIAKLLSAWICFESVPLHPCESSKTLDYWNQTRLILNVVTVFDAAIERETYPAVTNDIASDGPYVFQKSGATTWYHDTSKVQADNLCQLSMRLMSMDTNGVSPRLVEWTYDLAGYAAAVRLAAEDRSGLARGKDRRSRSQRRNSVLAEIAGQGLVPDSWFRKVQFGRRAMDESCRRQQRLELLWQRHELSIALTTSPLAFFRVGPEDGCPVVTFVTPGQRGDRAGIDVGDMLLSYNGVPLHNECNDNNILSDARLEVEEAGTPTNVIMEVQRIGQPRTINVEAGWMAISFSVSPRVWQRPFISNKDATMTDEDRDWLRWYCPPDYWWHESF